LFNSRIKSVHTIIVEGDPNSVENLGDEGVRQRYRNGIGNNVEVIPQSSGVTHGSLPNSSIGLDSLDRVLKIRDNKTSDNAQLIKRPTGGIDFTANRTPLEIRNGGGEIKFHLDPAMIRQLQNAPGFVPEIINIQPLKDLPGFLGISK
jgi:hypothetical protein